MKIYIASKTKYADRWKKLRSQGVEIISTWIDEAGEGDSKDLTDLALRCVDEVRKADRLVLYCEPADCLKGALVEVGAAFAFGIPVFAVGVCQSTISVFSWHPLWREALSLHEALGGLAELNRRYSAETVSLSVK